MQLILFDNGNLSDQLFGYEYPMMKSSRINIDNTNNCEIVWEYEALELV